MKIKLLIMLLSFYGSIYAQVENTMPPLRIGESTGATSIKGMSDGLLGAEPYTPPKGLDEYTRRTPDFDMTGNNGFVKPQAENTPKWFKKDKEIKDEYKSDQYLGDFKSNGEFVQLLYRDHEYVDGDIVRIYLNDQVIVSKIFLGGDFRGIGIDLEKGFNKIDIEALNQGESGPNTAEFHLYDDKGNLITSNEWNLTTGVKATLIVVKQ